MLSYRFVKGKKGRRLILQPKLMIKHQIPFITFNVLCNDFVLFPRFAHYCIRKQANTFNTLIVIIVQCLRYNILEKAFIAIIFPCKK